MLIQRNANKRKSRLSEDIFNPTKVNNQQCEKGRESTYADKKSEGKSIIFKKEGCLLYVIPDRAFCDWVLHSRNLIDDGCSTCGL